MEGVQERMDFCFLKNSIRSRKLCSWMAASAIRRSISRFMCSERILPMLPSGIEPPTPGGDEETRGWGLSATRVFLFTSRASMRIFVSKSWQRRQGLLIPADSFAQRCDLDFLGFGERTQAAHLSPVPFDEDIIESDGGENSKNDDGTHHKNPEEAA